MKRNILTILVSCIALIGLAGCASEVDREDRRFFYDSWKPSPPKASQAPERSHEEIFKDKPQ